LADYKKGYAENTKSPKPATRDSFQPRKKSRKNVFHPATGSESSHPEKQICENGVTHTGNHALSFSQKMQKSDRRVGSK
jgi:hypothetical protein